jgi:hypothetical protein
MASPEESITRERSERRLEEAKEIERESSESEIMFPAAIDG